MEVKVCGKSRLLKTFSLSLSLYTFSHFQAAAAADPSSDDPLINFLLPTLSLICTLHCLATFLASALHHCWYILIGKSTLIYIANGALKRRTMDSEHHPSMVQQWRRRRGESSSLTICAFQFLIQSAPQVRSSYNFSHLFSDF